MVIDGRAPGQESAMTVEQLIDALGKNGIPYLLADEIKNRLLRELLKRAPVGESEELDDIFLVPEISSLVALECVLTGPETWRWIASRLCAPDRAQRLLQETAGVLRRLESARDGALSARATGTLRCAVHLLSANGIGW